MDLFVNFVFINPLNYNHDVIIFINGGVCRPGF